MPTFDAKDLNLNLKSHEATIEEDFVFKNTIIFDNPLMYVESPRIGKFKQNEILNNRCSAEFIETIKIEQ